MLCATVATPTLLQSFFPFPSKKSQNSSIHTASPHNRFHITASPVSTSIVTVLKLSGYYSLLIHIHI